MKKLTTILCSVLIAASALAQNPDSTYRYFLWGGIESKTKPKERENHYRVTFYKGNPTALDKFKYDETVPDPSTYDVGVKIGETVWATRNVDEFGKFADNPQDAGKFYQWNKPKAWATTGDIIGWNVWGGIGSEWEKANDPCPAGWKVPTLAQLQELLFNAENIWTNNYNGSNRAGRIFGSGNNIIFFPAVGCINVRGMRETGVGYYWSSVETPNDYAPDTFAYYFSINTGSVESSRDRGYGQSVRCVKE